jgi:hypothetical protein
MPHYVQETVNLYQIYVYVLGRRGGVILALVVYVAAVWSRDICCLRLHYSITSI